VVVRGADAVGGVVADGLPHPIRIKQVIKVSTTRQTRTDFFFTIPSFLFFIYSGY
jgi:hypothetical protein